MQCCTEIKKFTYTNINNVINKLLSFITFFSKLVQLQQKIFSAMMSLSFFTLQTWTFKNTKFLNLFTHVPDAEKDDFYFNLDEVENVENIFINVLTGTQKYLFNTNSKKAEQAKNRLEKSVLNSNVFYNYGNK